MAEVTGDANGNELNGTDEADTINGLGGADTIHAGGGDDQIDGGDGDDVIYDGDGNDTVHGGLDNDTFFNGLGDDIFYGGAGDDIFSRDFPQGGSDQLYGEDGNDRFIANAASGSQLVDGGNGDDYMELGLYSVFPGANFFTALGGSGRDTILVSSGTSSANGGFGNEIDAGADDDFVAAFGADLSRVTLGTGADTLQLGLGTAFGLPNGVRITDYTVGVDRLQSQWDGPNTFQNWDGSSNPFATGHLRVMQDGADAVLQRDYDGPTGISPFNTLARFENVSAASLGAADLGGYSPDGSQPVGLTLTGTDNDDLLSYSPTIAGTLAGGLGSDTISGGAGNDQIYGGAGDDHIHGGNGNDTIWTGPGRDSVSGGNGDDVIRKEANSTDLANSTLTGDAGNDEFYYAIGTANAANLLGGDVYILGGDDNDKFFVWYTAEAGSTIVIDGGAGDDEASVQYVLDPSSSIDLGDGADRISIFETFAGTVALGTGEDTINLQNARFDFGPLVGQSLLTTVTDYAAEDTIAWNFANVLQGWAAGSDPFAGGFLRLGQQGQTTVLEIDRDGGGDAFSDLIVFAGTTPGSFDSADFAGFQPVAVNYQLRPTGSFENPALLVAGFGAGASAGGWANQHTYPRTMADVDGNGRLDIVGFGSGGAWVSLTDAGGVPGTPYLAMNYFGADAAAGGWSDSNVFPRDLADVNGDGRADLFGFGAAGVYAALADGTGAFGEVFLATGGYGADLSAGGWSNNNLYPRLLADVNGDGMDDIVGFGDGGAHVSLATGGGSFAEAILGTAGFGAGASAGGWSDNDIYTRTLADMNGDGRADVVGFGSGGVHIALANADGTFASPFFAFAGFGAETAVGGWTSNDLYYRTVGDLDGDGNADLVGFGEGGVYAAYGDGAGGFAAAEIVVAGFGAGASAGGWSSQDLYPRLLADMNGDGADDIVGFGDGGVIVAASVSDWVLV